MGIRIDLIHQIEGGLYQWQVLMDKVTNFEHRLPYQQSEFAVQIMKALYVFEFVPFREDMFGQDIEQTPVWDVTKFLLEFGTSIVFERLGKQQRLNFFIEYV